MKDFTFDGFDPANTTPVPDIFFDELLSVLSGAELKVMLYIIRRTLGFKKSTDAISLTQFEDGITTKDNRVLDKGCGLNRETICKALESLEERGCIKSQKSSNSRNVKEITVYSIRFKGDEKVVGKSDQGSRKIREKVVGKSDQGSRKIREKVVGKSDIQETVKQETVKQETVLQSTPLPPNGESLSLPPHLQKKLPIATHSLPSCLRRIRMSPIEEPKGVETPKTDSLEKIKPLPAPSKPGKEEPWNVPTCLRLADYYRGHPLEESKVESSPYQKALRGAIKAIQHGHTYEQIDSVFGYMKCLDPNFKDEWWKDKVVDLWHVAEHCSVKLREIERKKRGEPQKPPTYVICSQDPEYCIEKDFGSKSETEREKEDEIKRVQAASVSG